MVLIYQLKMIIEDTMSPRVTFILPVLSLTKV